MSLAHAWGSLIGRYSLQAVPRQRLRVCFEEPPGREPCIWVCWHEANLVAIAAHRHVIDRPVVAITPAGVRGAAMRGWLESMGVTPVPLADERETGASLRRVQEALASNHDVLIAVDGPRGPRRHAKVGALWLAATTGTAVVPIGAAAQPALRLPRWDRHIVPLSGARVVVVTGAPLRYGRSTWRNNEPEQLTRILNALTERAAQGIQTDNKDRLPEAA